jgi:hypothetical protein
MDSPIQEHPALLANDLQWLEGKLETLGNPHHYVNQEDLVSFTLQDAHVSPWTVTGLPVSRAAQIIVARATAQFLLLPGESAREMYREPPRTKTLIFYTPLAVIRGEAPFLSEARLHNFLEFWKGLFVPIGDARIHYLMSAAAEMPAQSPLLYLNRTVIQSYVEA